MRRIIFLTVFLLSTFYLLLTTDIHAQTALGIVSVTDNRSNYQNGEIPKYEKLEISFNINAATTNPFFPHDPNPPPGITPDQGISVDGHFTPDNWQTVYTVPGFYYQPYEHQVKRSQDWIYPQGLPEWRVRFSPNQVGTWHYKLTAQNQSGQAESSIYQFTVAPSDSHGFIRVSPNDPRYFEFDDGTYFPGLGYNMNFDQVDWKNPIQSNQNNFQIMGQNGINFIRIWLSQWKIYGAMWKGWNYTGNGEAIYLTVDEAYPGSDVSMHVRVGNNPCMSSAHWVHAPIALKQDTTYRVKVRVKTSGLSGPAQAGKPYGFVVKTGQLSWMGNTCDNPDLGTRMTASLTTDSDWTTVEGSYNSNNLDYLNGIYFTLENLSAGTAYIDRVWMEEDAGEWGSQPNLIVQSWMAHHYSPDQRMSYAFDRTLQLAEQNNIYFRPVLLDHNDWIFNRIDFDGNMTTANTNDNFYGNWRQITKVRWLQQAWWRYLQARWGYSPAIHSWENQNEGDPWNGLHYTMADELGKYMHCGAFAQPTQSTNGWLCSYQHPNRHLVSDSNWHSYPVNNFWSNSDYPNIDFADFHRYYHEGSDYTIGSDRNTYTLPSSNFYDTALAHKSVSDILSPLGSESAGKPVVLGEMSFWSGGHATSEFANDTQGIWLHNYIWAHIVPSAVIGSYWDAHNYWGHIVCQNCSFGVNYDHRHHFGSYYHFIEIIPLSNGNYEDAQAQVSDNDLRVWGQKDLINNRAHLWIQNKNHTWKNVVDRVNVSPVSDTVTVGGFSTNTDYQVEWWDTYTGTPTTVESITTNSSGELTLSVSDLTTDTAVRIGDYTQTSPTPTPIIMPGDANGDNKVDGVDYVIWLTQYLNYNPTPNSDPDFNQSGTVDGIDYVIWLNNYTP